MLRQCSQSTARKAKERCLPMKGTSCAFRNNVKKGDVIQIPRKNEMRHFLAVNKLVGKILLSSDMEESEIFDEIRSVFHGPMDNDVDFSFKILQPSGGDSRSLIIPELSHSYQWSASAVAGRNGKTPIYILAEDLLEVCLWYTHVLCQSTPPSYFSR